MSRRKRSPEEQARREKVSSHKNLLTTYVTANQTQPKKEPMGFILGSGHLNHINQNDSDSTKLYAASHSCISSTVTHLLKLHVTLSDCMFVCNSQAAPSSTA